MDDDKNKQKFLYLPNFKLQYLNSNDELADNVEDINKFAHNQNRTSLICISVLCLFQRQEQFCFSKAYSSFDWLDLSRSNDAFTLRRHDLFWKQGSVCLGDGAEIRIG